MKLWPWRGAAKPQLPVLAETDEVVIRGGVVVGDPCPLGKDCLRRDVYVIRRATSLRLAKRYAQMRESAEYAADRPAADPELAARVDRVYWEFDAWNVGGAEHCPIPDGSAEHKALHGLVFRFDDPFWQDFFPMIGPKCRCAVRALTAKECRDRGLQVRSSSGRLSVEDGAAVYRLDDGAAVRVSAMWAGVPPVDGYPGDGSRKFKCRHCGAESLRDRRQ